MILPKFAKNKMNKEAFMTYKKRTKEELLAALEKTKQRKHEIAMELIDSMKADYEQETGKKANYVFVL